MDHNGMGVARALLTFGSLSLLFLWHSCAISLKFIFILCWFACMYVSAHLCVQRLWRPEQLRPLNN